MRPIAICIVLLFQTFSAYSQVEKSDALYRTIKENDSLLFNVGFNTCNLEMLQSLMSNRFTFYHDQTGIIESKEHFLESVKNGICELPYTAVRTIDQSSVSIFPLKRNDTIYGAIQQGEHSFYAYERDNQKFLTSIAKFTHVWTIEDGKWKLRSALSYDHQDFDKKDGIDKRFTHHEITKNWLKEKNVPCLGIGFIENGQIVQASVFGELTKGQSAPLNTMWNVASMTKPITATVALLLIDQGLWSLDEPIYGYYTDPDVVDDPRSKLLTTRMILSHQSGFPNWRESNSDKNLKFEFEPGTKYQYSGEGYEYLRKALEAKFGKSLEQMAQEHIFIPLGMHNTHFVWSDTIEQQPFALWHTRTGECYKTEKYFTTNAADNLLTTVEDYTKFIQFILQGAGLSDSLQKEMMADQVRVSPLKHFGLGWWVDEKINESQDFALVLAGDDIGVHCIAFVLPNTKKALLIFTNSDNGTDVYMDVISHYLENDAKGIFNAEMNSN